jgi:hypothetical protein
MPSSITANLSSFGNSYLSIWRIWGGFNGTATFTASGNVFTTTATIPMSTGDLVYLSQFGYPQATTTRYMIKLTDNTFSLATTQILANTGTASALPYPVAETGISNVPLNGKYFAFSILGNIPSGVTNSLMSSSRSAQSFAVTDNVQIDFSVSVPIQTPSQYSSYTFYYYVFGLRTDAGNYSCIFADDGAFWSGDTITGFSADFNTGYVPSVSKTLATTTFRITLQNRRISIANRRTDSTYTTLFTSSVLSLNLSNLRFFTNLTLDGQAFTNCTITYL